jgi:hypothetical protein
MCMKIVGTVLKNKKQHRVTATTRERERGEKKNADIQTDIGHQLDVVLQVT